MSKKNFPKAEKSITQILILATVIFLVLTTLMFYGYKLKGIYSNPTVGVVFILISLLYFAVVQNTKRKIIAVVLLTPLILLSLLTLLFGRTIYEVKTPDNYKIQVSTGGIMSCGELIHLTKSKFVIFDKEVIYESNLCLRGIKRIEVISFDQDSAEFLIYHNGKIEPENPYNYRVKNINQW